MIVSNDLINTIYYCGGILVGLGIALVIKEIKEEAHPEKWHKIKQ